MSATFRTVLSRLVVTFDGILTAGSTNPAAWTIRISNRLRNPSMATAGGNLVEVFASPGAFNTGPNVCSYDGTPPPITDFSGNPIAAFTDFPVTLI